MDMDTRLLAAAIEKTARKSSYSPKELAYIMDIDYQQFMNKTLMSNPDAKLNIFQAVELQLITKDHSIHHAMGQILGEHSIPVSKSGHETLFTAVLHAMKEHGDIYEAIDEAMADGVMTTMERHRCAKEITEAIEALVRLRANVMGDEPTGQNNLGDHNQ